MKDPDVALNGFALTEAISEAMVGLYGRFYDHERTTATTYINDNVVVCILEDILSAAETTQIDGGETATWSSTVGWPSRRGPRTSSPRPSSG